MKHALCLLALLVVLCILVRRSPPEYAGLPHRQDWELYKQANSPAAKDCPVGTTPIYVIEADTAFFIECYRETSE